ncbi:glycosyl transferase [candidate division WOR-1 bacterium RIFCSPLOWO2_02_FULL_46_20]|uniref:Glycosyl transferase n=2 Tax=Saganbacteria TaxID=1703751 RepID=A0A1F4R6W7_UNCSA|nr:MAG: glycosyl transferase [candidate division WOR-1 bacterium RIFCSPHIGHO2_02_FULL_45_12]OGC03909.1 MAG: glycosyl transferase [candidate division WOR-1 bacterium RIFCSPLOWO2_02_FULL_46_20]OGC09307.1 MAG: glycosyl transferase [candidate division WOR-1 bacterium RIFCSPLOWO2_12_FULL_45_9]
MKIAIVHDFLNQFGGAERVISALNEIYPEAPIFTSIYDAAALPANFQKMDIRVSFMQKLPFVFKLFKWYLFLYPLAFEAFDLSEYDVILSSSSAFAKGVRKRDDQLHVCYCHTPMRFVWRYDDYVKKESIPAYLKNILPYFLEPMKKWDVDNTNRIDYFIANSRTVAERIQETYRRESVIINPPVDCGLFRPSELNYDYFLVVSRLNAYKRVDIVIETFNKLDLPLKIIGDGPESVKLKRLAGPNVEFLGRLADEQVARHMAGCQALVFPGEEDFGIVPLEVMSAGRPVIAYKAGGATETVIDGLTGVFFTKQDVCRLDQAIKRFQFESFDKRKIRQHAQEFDKEIFKSNMRSFIETRLREFK